MRTATLTAVVLLMLLGACASPSAEVATAPTTPGDAPSEASEAATPAATQDRLTGALAGDPDLEGGCVWLDTGDGRRVEILWPDGYRAAADPVELRDAGGEVIATEGDTITVEGALADDRVSTCQIGEIWTATAVERPAGN